MIIIILLGIIAFLVTLISTFREFGYEYFISNLIISFLAGICGASIGLLIAWSIPMKTKIVKTTYNLECLKDNNSTNDKFFLGIGQIDGSLKYVFYYKENKLYKIHQVNYFIEIKYSNDKTKAEKYDEVPCKKTFINYFAIDIDLKKYYIIYIPKGTIKHNYNLDTQ